jgi:lupus La protein
MKIIEKPFLAAPPGSGGGKLAKSDSSVITEEDLQKLKDAKITHGGVEIVWSRPSSECLMLSIDFMLNVQYT